MTKSSLRHWYSTRMPWDCVRDTASYHHGRPQNSFLGWANYILDQAKGYYNPFHSQNLIQISYFVPKISQMSDSWTRQVPSLAHWCGRPWLSLLLSFIFILASKYATKYWYSWPRVPRGTKVEKGENNNLRIKKIVGIDFFQSKTTLRIHRN